MPSNTTKRKDKMETDQTLEIVLPPRKTRKRTKPKFKLDPNTANGSLSLSENNAVATYAREKQSYPHHPDRFAFWQQVLCAEGLTGCWKWEVEVSGWVSVGVAYRSIPRGAVDAGLLGFNPRSWSLVCSEGRGGARYTACHDKKMIEHRGAGHVDSPCRIEVHLDTEEGDLTFFRVSAGGSELKMLHTFNARFTGPLYPAFRLGWYGSSVSLLQLTKM